MGRRNKPDVAILTDTAVHVVRSQPGTFTPGRSDIELPGSLLAGFECEPLAEAIASAATIAGAGRRLVLVVPMRWAFTQVLTAGRRRAAQQAIWFEFEEYLPVAVDELTCAVWRLGPHQQLAAGIPTQPMNTLIESLGERGMEVEQVYLDAALALSAHASPSAGGAAIRTRDWLHALARAEDGSVVPWVAAAPQMHAMADCLASGFDQRRPPNDGHDCAWTVLNLTDDIASGDNLAESETTPDAHVHVVPHGEAINILAKAAASATAPLGLRSGALAARHTPPVQKLALQCLCLATVAALCCAGGLRFYHGVLAENLQIVQAAQLRCYRLAFDADALPPAAALHMASERLRLEKLTGAEPLPRETPASPVEELCRFVSRLPADLRFMLLEIRVDELQWTMRGQTAEHRDAERIVEALNQVPHVGAKPPRTRRRPEGGVEFSVMASRNP